MPAPYYCFIDDFILLTIELATQHRMLIAGDFNLDQMLPEHVAKVDPLIQVLTCLSIQNIQLLYMEEYCFFFALTIQ